MNIEFTKQTVPAIRDNFNRSSSCCRSRGGYVVHSGVHRSTAFVSLPHAVASLEYWRAAGPEGLNGWIEATIDGAALADCELNALARLLPEWTFVETRACGTASGSVYTASHKARGFETRVGGSSWRDLHARLSRPAKTA